MQQWQVLEYQTFDGKFPFSRWLLSLKDINARARINTRINRLKLGSLGDTKSVGEGVFELKFHFGAGYRIYYGQEGRTIIILLCGGDKSSQAKDIKIAHEYWQDYKRRKANEAR